MILHDTDAGGEIRAEADAVLEACRRGSALTSQLMTFARRETLPARHLDLNDVVRDIVGLASRVIDRRITLETRFDPDGARVCMNKSQLEQIIMNLVLNARDAIGGGTGSITISTCSRLSNTSLRIADTGAGMTDEVRRRLFEPFFTTKSGSGGTGLGLSTVYAIVTKIGGSIEVESTPGLGSAFEILFPDCAATDSPQK
jgi:signal transduction histidine kinase